MSENKSKRNGNDGRRLHAAFARAAREDAELRRLKASGKPWAALDFHPHRLGSESATHATPTSSEEQPWRTS